MEMEVSSPTVRVWTRNGCVWCVVESNGRTAFSYGVPVRSISTLRVRLKNAGLLKYAASQLEQVEASLESASSEVQVRRVDLAVVSMIGLWICFFASVFLWAAVVLSAK